MRKLVIALAMVLAAAPAFAGNAKLGLEIETNDTGKPGVIVLGVAPGSPAEKSGIVSGDIIDQLDGKPIRDAQQFAAALSHAGANVKLHVVHPVLPASTVMIALGGDGGVPSPHEIAGAPKSQMPPQMSSQAGKPPMNVRWTRYRDPNEGAFTIDVPQGWHVAGGAYSMNAVETRTGVEARSPDGSIVLFVGDKDIPIFTVPNQMFAMAGLRPGMNYSPGYNQNMLIEPYETGDQFAAQWGARRISRECAGVRPAQVRPLPQASRAMDYAYAQGGLRTSLRAGEASFSCKMRGAPGAGYVFAATELVEAQGNAIWDVKHLAGFASTMAHVRQASQLLGHMAASFMPDREWLARHNQTAMAVSHIVTETGHAISDSINGAYWNHAASEDRVFQGNDEAVRGVNTYRDQYGNEFQLDSSRAHWWVDGDGNKIPTDNDQRPCWNCRELQVVPPGH